MICDVHMSLFMCMLSGNLDMNFEKKKHKKNSLSVLLIENTDTCLRSTEFGKKVLRKGKSNSKKTTVFEKKLWKPLRWYLREKYIVRYDLYYHVVKSLLNECQLFICHNDKSLRERREKNVIEYAVDVQCTYIVVLLVSLLLLLLVLVLLVLLLHLQF